MVPNECHSIPLSPQLGLLLHTFNFSKFNYLKKNRFLCTLMNE
ncbi:7864_t:CDS:2 [Racocetra fulgida]|uniref:7864_t:CDS:1 n=1 Tax=Racocetra fulgida TaxID=60492 RepID=A0A9N8VK46_9GLOM|nr:7864_t:CDS:2 [Racocetra fulgida]